MFTDTINKCAANAARIVRLAKESPLGFWISSAMAGAYVGLGIILIFTLGNLVDPSVRPLVMGATFGIALTLVIIAGSELFTGHTMFLTLGVKAGTIRQSQMWAVLPQTWLGNLLGSVLVALMYYYGGGSLLPVDTSLVHSAALAKTTAPAEVLFFKGVLCNWLVCLAIWMAIRVRRRQVHRHLVVPAGLYRLGLRTLRRQHDAVRPLLVRQPQRGLHPRRHRPQPAVGDARQYPVRLGADGSGVLVRYAARRTPAGGESRRTSDRLSFRGRISPPH